MNSRSPHHFTPKYVGYCLLVLLGSCTVGPDYSAPEPVIPSAWSSNELAAGDMCINGLADWWNVFDDPSLSGLIERAIANNPDRDLALARLRESRARFRSSRSRAWPALSQSGSKSVTESTDIVGQADRRTPYDTSLDASWELDLFGGIRNSVDAAEASIEALEATYLDVMTSLVADVALAYIDFRTLEERLRLTHASVATQESTFELTRFRTEAGLITGLNLEQARANLESTRAQIPLLERDLQLTRNNLFFLTGSAPGTAELAIAEGTGIPAAPKQFSIWSPDNVISQRADVRAAERNLAAQSARIGVAEASLYPTLRLVGSYSYSKSNFFSLFNDTFTTSTLTSAITAPIFNAGQLRANVEIEDALFEQSLASFEKTVQNALREVEDSLVRREAAFERTENLRLAVEAAELANELATQEYEAGLTPFDQVLDAQRTLLTAEEQLALNLATETTSTISLYRAVGGGWTAALSGDEFESDDSCAPFSM